MLHLGREIKQGQKNVFSFFFYTTSQFFNQSMYGICCSNWDQFMQFLLILYKEKKIQENV